MRKATAFAYLIVGLSLFEKLWMQDKTINFNIALLATLVIASFQACLFTYATITLIDIQFFKRKNLFWELGIISGFAITLVLSCFLGGKDAFLWTFHIFSVYYFIQLVRYTRLFFRHYHIYKNRADNYFSEQEAGRLQWVAWAFYSALSIGVLALVMLYAPLWVYVSVQVIMIAYYFYFGVRFINYAFRFQDIQPVLSAIQEPDSQKADIPSTLYNNLEKSVTHWVNEKKFTEAGITIESMAANLATNRTYLSSYINSQKGKTFKLWINELRIEEAKRLLLSNPSLPIKDAAEQVGISDKSNFGRLFTRIEGCSPHAWRKINDR